MDNYSIKKLVEISRKHRMQYCIIIILVISMIICFVSIPACSEASPTPGYILYKWDSLGRLVSFEYPDTWELEIEKQVDGLSKGDRINIYFGSNLFNRDRNFNEVYIESLSQVNSDSSTSYCENAQSLITGKLSNLADLDEYRYIEGDRITLGKAKGEWIVYSYYDHDFIYPTPYDHRHYTCRFVAGDYKGRIYILSQRVSTDWYSYEEFKPGFDHILETFKFLD